MFEYEAADASFMLVKRNLLEIEFTETNSSSARQHINIVPTGTPGRFLSGLLTEIRKA